jgi:hypothetical protein
MKLINIVDLFIELSISVDDSLLIKTVIGKLF